MPLLSDALTFAARHGTGALGVLAVAAAVGAMALLVWAWRDYRAWIALGPGGLPPNLFGWGVMTLLRLFKRDARRASALTRVRGAADDGVYLGALMPRPGPRPVVPPHPIPQRQLTDLPPPAVQRRLEGLFSRFVSDQPEVLTWARSAFERHHQAVVLCRPGCGWRQAARWHGEVAHIHPGDGSMHMILSPSDSAQVVARGWGELHTLSGRLGLLPPSYTFVYAPRTEQEVEVIGAILQAAVRHMSRREPAADQGLR